MWPYMRRQLARVRSGRSRLYGAPVSAHPGIIQYPAALPGRVPVIGFDPSLMGAPDLDLLGADEELDALEDEIDELMGEDDEYEYQRGPNGQLVLGANLTRIDQKIQDLSQRETDLATIAQTTSGKSRRKATRQLKRVRKKLARLRGKQSKKVGVMAANLGLPAAAVDMARGAELTDLTGIEPREVASAERRLTQAQSLAAYGVEGRYPAQTPARVQVPIGLVDADTGEEEVLVVFTPGAGIRTVNWAMNTEPIPYADLKVIGISATFGAQQTLGGAGLPLGQAFGDAYVDTYIVDGGSDMLYTRLSVYSAGEVSRSENAGWSSIIKGRSIRMPSALQQNNRLRATGIIKQFVANDSDVTYRLQLTAICEQIFDPQAQRGALV